MPPLAALTGATGSVSTSPLGERQVDAEDGAAADLAFDRDVAAALLDDAVDHRQAEAGALARPLGGEEGLEDPRQHRRRHAGAGVGDRQHHVGAGRDLGPVGGVGGVDIGLVDLERRGGRRPAWRRGRSGRG